MSDIIEPARTRPPARDRRAVPAEQMDRWREEEPALIRAWQDEGSEQALTTLLDRYGLFFKSQIARIFAGRSIPYTHRADLEQEASLAFITAVSRFDLDAGTQLSSLATRYVRNALLRYCLDFRYSYRIGTGSEERKAYYAALSRRAQKIRAGKSDFLTDADIDAIRSRTGASRKATKRAVDSIYAQTIDVETADELEAEHNEQEEGDGAMSMASAIDMLGPYVSTLDDRRSEILETFARHGEIDTRALAEKYGVTPERIGQIRREMMAQMAEHLRARGVEADDLF